MQEVVLLRRHPAANWIKVNSFSSKFMFFFSSEVVMKDYPTILSQARKPPPALRD